MFKRYLSLFFILSILSFLLTGCYDSTSIEESTYPIAIGIDESTKNMIFLSIELPKSPSSRRCKRFTKLTVLLLPQ